MPGVISHKVQYQVRTPVYSGPLDLLLQLIERAELDITKISLAQVTGQYLATLEQMTDRSPEELSAFLVVAAKLLQIKSEALLPRPPQRHPEEEDPSEALVRQLKEYRAFKRAAEWLKARREAKLYSFVRLQTPNQSPPPVPLKGYTAADLLGAARRAFGHRDAEPLRRVIRPPKITLREKISLIVQTLKRKRRAFFSALLPKKPTRVETVVTFLAVLELTKQRLIHAEQPSLFADIEITPAQENLDAALDTIPEFGE